MSTEATSALFGVTRRRLARRTAAAVAACALVIAPGVASVQSASAADSDKPTFTVGMLQAVDSFNPFNGIVAESYEMWALMYDYMIGWSPKDMSPSKEGGLAEDWDTSPDGLTWTFHIRSGVKWNDGVPLTAHDIAYTYNRILDGGPEAASWGSYLKSVDTITAPDDQTVVLQLKKPNAVLPLLPMPILPEHVWKNVDEKDVKTYSNEPSGGQPVVGSGPFNLVEGTADGDTYRFEANPDYWDGAPNVDEVDYSVYRSQDTLVQALEAGEIDFAEDVTPLQLRKLEGNSDITTSLGDSPGFDEIAFNVGSVDMKDCDGIDCKPMGDPDPAVLDKNFRFALNFALDRQKLIDSVYQGAGQPGTTIIPPAYSQFQWQPDDPDAFAYDPDKANQLLDDAGYQVGSDGWRTEKNGDPLKLQLYARTDSESSKGTMEFLKEWLKDVHVNSEVVGATSNKLTNIILDGTFDVFQWGWYVEPDPDSMLSYFTCGQRGNWSDSWYCNPQYDQLYQAQHSETDLAKRQDDVRQMQQMLYDDAPYLVTVYSSIGEAYRSDRFTGFVPQPDPGGVLLFQYGHANYLNLKPVTAADTASGGGSTAAAAAGDSGSSTGEVVAIVIVVIVLLVLAALVVVWATRRRASADARE
jgi:peptide/nickel transport system substrate-binding protein